MKNFALKYLQLGLSVIPLRPNGKEPLFPWKEYQKRLPTEAEVIEWWTQSANANIGIVTGLISGVVVIDLDGPEGLQTALAMNLTSSVISFTGRGKHLWYRHPGGTNNIENAVRKYPGLDIRGDGGYVVAPPSVHENGHRYRWLKPFVGNAINLPSFPSHILTSVKPVDTAFKPRLDISTALKGMTNGNIDSTLFSVCSKLRNDGYSADDARVLLQPHADRVKAEPGHLDEKIQNVWSRYDPKPRYIPGMLRTETPQEYATRGLVIHTPTNPDSLKQYEQLQLANSCDGTNESNGFKTGYAKLDTLLKGGLKSSRLFTIAARTGVGKTNWVISVARTLCISGKKVLLFSTEMPYSQIWERYIATLDNPESFNDHQLFICDSFAPNLANVEEAIRQIKPDLFVFDHINHVAEDPQELGTFMQGLNLLRRKYDCAGIITAQLNRNADWIDLKTGEKTIPRMSMIKGSGTIEQASSRVMLLSETRVTPEGTEIVGNLDKNDNGPKGLCHFMLKTDPYRMEEI